MQCAQSWQMQVNSANDAVAETELIRSGLAGDQQALSALLTRYERPLYLLCRGMLRHSEDAEDAVQETLLKALNALATFRFHSSFRTWLFRIAIRSCLDRKQSKRADPAWSEVSPDTVSPTHSPETTVLRQMRMLDALAVLQPRQRALVLLKELHGCSIAEIAETLSWNQKKVHNELSKARSVLAVWRAREEGNQS